MLFYLLSILCDHSTVLLMSGSSHQQLEVKEIKIFLTLIL